MPKFLPGYRSAAFLLALALAQAATFYPAAAPAGTAVTLRGTLATPVDQSGPRARIRGTLGEPVVGTARGGGIEVRSGLRRPVLDLHGPIWTLGAFPNPYLEEFIDLVLVADEPLAEGSVTVEIGGTPVTPQRLAGDGHAWWIDNALAGPIATTNILCCGTDLNGNVGCFEAGVSALIVEARSGGRLAGVDGMTSLVIEPGALQADSWLILAALQDGAVQVLGPPGAPMTLERNARHESAGTADLSRLFWLGPGGPLDSWHDTGTGHVFGRALGPGIYRLEAGPPGSSRPISSPRVKGARVSPNPFMASTTIHYELDAPRVVSLRIVDVAGRLVAQLAESVELPAGPHFWLWNGRARNGAPAPAGIYFVRLTDGDRDRVTKVVRVR